MLGDHRRWTQRCRGQERLWRVEIWVRKIFISVLAKEGKIFQAAGTAGILTAHGLDFLELRRVGWVPWAISLLSATESMYSLGAGRGGLDSGQYLGFELDSGSFVVGLFCIAFSVIWYGQTSAHNLHGYAAWTWLEATGNEK
jgi:hypothetical protein